jgi:transposase
MTAVMMGIDPHKGSHTAVAIDAGEVPLGRVRIRACPDQAVQLLVWARPRTAGILATSRA